ncbi:ATP-binding protein [Methanosphaera cuniculi]|uniref:ATP-binding protein n=1 Tax=Methanosphaera cuniculi TaxID=1077256 RepID=UPI0026EE0257|nr:4Fe-4S binding protein [Methanosphaera cuniculi]
MVVYTVTTACEGCDHGPCLDACQFDAITKGNPYKINPEVCTGCGACAKVCPVDAIVEIQSSIDPEAEKLSEKYVDEVVQLDD